MNTHTTIPNCNLNNVINYLNNVNDNNWHILEIQDKKLYEIETYLLDYLLKIINDEEFVIKESRVYDKKYSGLSLQNDGTKDNPKSKSIRPLNGRPPYTELLQSKLSKNDKQYQIENKKFIYLNDFATRLNEIISYFSLFDIMLERGRLLTIKGNHAKEIIHADNDIRLHFPIITNFNNIFYFYDRDYNRYSYHLSKGKFYLFNAWIKHSFVNLSVFPRTHLVFTLWSNN